MTTWTPDTFVSGISSIQEIGPGIVRVTFFVIREDAEGRPENVICGHQVWSTAQWLESLSIASASWEMMQADKHKPRLAVAAVH